MKKYELTDEKKIVERCTLCRIRALRDFADVKAGDLGGFVESENNLSHRDDAWVRGNAHVAGKARVSDNARVIDDACVSDSVRVFDDAWVSGNARVSGDTWVFGNTWVPDHAHVAGDARVDGKARVYGDTWVFGNAWVRDNATVGGNATVSGNARIGRDAKINNSHQYLTVSPIGNRSNAVTFFRTRSGGVGVNCGCFSGTVDEFAAKVEKTYGGNKFGREYKAAIELAKVHILGGDDK